MTRVFQLYCKGLRLVYDEVCCLNQGDGESTRSHTAIGLDTSPVLRSIPRDDI